MDVTAELRQVLESLVRLMVDRPEDVRVVLIQATGTILQVQVHPVDLGKVIGKEGRNARSLRVIFLAIATTAKIKVSIDIIGTEVD